MGGTYQELLIAMGDHLMRQVILIPDDEAGGYTVEVPSLPECVTEGDTIDEALANAREAIESYEESFRLDGLPIPEDNILVRTVEA